MPEIVFIDVELDPERMPHLRSFLDCSNRGLAEAVQYFPLSDKRLFLQKEFLISIGQLFYL